MPELGRLFLPALAEFSRQHPSIALVLDFSDALADASLVEVLSDYAIASHPTRTWRRKCGRSSISWQRQAFCCQSPTAEAMEIHSSKYIYIMASLPDALRAPSWTCRNEALARYTLCLQA
ncbi:hypothetical protein [Janthinobacterium sp. UMAB-56]|uniref:hypothetical protein n=1 Tax=Janthinobacterium sp. UMAB-56 TaxID=1365361 RepID=UPI001C55EFC6|nr:hypothetical protein [Janthinobacterium sp. UMAB-56]